MLGRDKATNIPMLIHARATRMSSLKSGFRITNKDETKAEREKKKHTEQDNLHRVLIEDAVDADTAAMEYIVLR